MAESAIREIISQKLMKASEFVLEYYPSGRGKVIFPKLVEDWLNAENQESYARAANEIQKLLSSGMGGFRDIPIEPKQDAKLSFLELNRIADTIFNDLYDELGAYLVSINSNSNDS